MIDQQDFSQILDECLARIHAGESVESCLESFPEEADALRPLLALSAAVKHTPPPKPSPTAMTAGKTAMMAAVAIKFGAAAAGAAAAASAAQSAAAASSGAASSGAASSGSAASSGGAASAGTAAASTAASTAAAGGLVGGVFASAGTAIAAAAATAAVATGLVIGGVQVARNNNAPPELTPTVEVTSTPIRLAADLSSNESSIPARDGSGVVDAQKGITRENIAGQVRVYRNGDPVEIVEDGIRWVAVYALPVETDEDVLIEAEVSRMSIPVLSRWLREGPTPEDTQVRCINDFNEWVVLESSRARIQPAALTDDFVVTVPIEVEQASTCAIFVAEEK